MVEYTTEHNNSSADVPSTWYYFTTASGNTVLSSIDYPNGEKEIFTYNANGQKLPRADASGTRTTYTYNDNGTTATITSPDNQVTSFTYADNGIDAMMTGACLQAVSLTAYALV